MGVMIDDLITRGATEPYRMFTSRAEYRLLLREDNADLRLTPIGRELGLVDDERWAVFNTKRAAIEGEQQRLNGIWVTPDNLPEAIAVAVLGQPLGKESNLLQLLRRPEVRYADLLRLPCLEDLGISAEVAEQVEIQARYHGYIERQEAEIERNRRDETTMLPEDLDYKQVRGLSNEALQKLSSHRPLTLGQAFRIPGMTPAAISLLRIHLKRHYSRLRESA
jgi:tRNA uridine 5-carboxymethylaminomethyl modification enzyme